MASVYQVKHLGLGSVHALKVLHAELAQDPDLRTRFLAEGQIQAQLKHQNIVHVTEIVTNPVAGLVMDFVDGQSLDGWLRARSKPLTLVEMLELFLPVLDALGAAHRFGVVHRDLKPENILVGQGPEGRPWPRVTDFGIAKVASQAQVGAARRTQAGTRMGTLLYMSPEQVRGAPDLDSRSDVFALGAILYELVTGKVAFDRHTEFETMKAIVAADYVPPEKLVSGLPAPLLGVIRRALAVEPSHRFADTALFRSALEGVPLPARAQTLWPTRATQPPTQPPMSGGQAWGVGAPVARPTVKYPPPQAQPRAAAPALRSNHLGVAMLSMLFFCFPVGLVATVYALRVMPALELGDGALAASHASKARSWAAAAVAAGTAVWSLMGWHFFHS
jgi:serine/threonine-protein kinase